MRNGVLAENSVLGVDAIIDLLGLCLITTYSQVNYRFYQQKEGMAIGNSVSCGQQYFYGIF